jgi:hypothetical protein
VNKSYIVTGLMEHTVCFGNRYYYFFVVLGLDLRAYTLNHSTSPFFVKGFGRYSLEELFAQAGFEPQSS